MPALSTLGRTPTTPNCANFPAALFNLSYNNSWHFKLQISCPYALRGSVQAIRQITRHCVTFHNMV